MSRRIRFGLAAFAAGAILVAYSQRHAKPDLRRTYRIDFEHSPPRQYVRADGRPTGSVIEIIDEAARRAGVRLEWIHVEGGPDRALSAGTVDLWPVLNRRPQRSHLHITEPFFEINYWLVSRDLNGGLTADGVAGRTVGVSAALVGQIAKERLRDVRVEIFPDMAQLVRAVCRGETPAGSSETASLSPSNSDSRTAAN